MHVRIAILALLIGCARGPQDPAWLTVGSRADHDRFFPVATGPHAVDCNSCHGTGESFRAFDCTTCHAQAPTSALHTQVGGFVWESASCYLCHPRGTGGISPAAHAQNFPIDTGSSHAAAACTSCHLDPARRQDVTCSGCHTPAGKNAAPPAPIDLGPAHQAKVGGSNWQAPSTPTVQCLLCHGHDAVVRVSTHGATAAHPGTFVIDPSHPGHFADCGKCHTVQVTDPGLKNPRIDFTHSSCDACHAPAETLSAHQGIGTPITAPYVAGEVNNSSACLSCHPNGGTAAGFTHAWFPIGSGAVHNSGVATCAKCHTSQASFSGPPAGNLGLINCLGCHTDAKTVHSAPQVGRTIWDVPGGASYVSNALCLKCHAGNIGGAVAAFSTPLVFRLAQHDLHCIMSDKFIGSPDPSVIAHAVNQNADNGVNICFACHDALATGTATPWATDWSVASPTSSCVACHHHQLSPPPPITCR